MEAWGPCVAILENGADRKYSEASPMQGLVSVGIHDS